MAVYRRRGMKGHACPSVASVWLTVAVLISFLLLAHSAVAPFAQKQQMMRESKLLQQFYKRGEATAINPASTIRFSTNTDRGMPGDTDFSVLARERLSSWDDTRLELTSGVYLPGMYQARSRTANGRFGFEATAAGPFFERDVNQTSFPNGNKSSVTNGWPLYDLRQTFGTVAGFFNCQEATPGVNYPELRSRGCESVIAGTPYPFTLTMVVDGQKLNATVKNTTIGNYSQRINFKDGTLHWRYTWNPEDIDVSFDINYTVFASRNRVNVAVTRLVVTPHGGNKTVTIVDEIDGRTAVRSALGRKALLKDSTSIYVSNYPEGLPYVEAFTLSTANVSNGYTNERSRRLSTHTDDSDMTIGQEWNVKLVDGEPAVFEKFVGIVSTDNFEAPEAKALNESLQAYEDGWDQVLSEHTQAWNKLMDRKLIANYRDPITGQLPLNQTIIERLQIEAVASRFYILSNLLPDDGSGLNVEGLSVGGLASSAYGAMRFWDQDFWMYLAIGITNPDYGRQILNFRVKQAEQARANSQEAYVQEKYKFNNKSVLYPWTSGRFGNATGTGPVLDYEYHLNFDIALAMLTDLAITGDEAYFREYFWPVVEGAGWTAATLLQEDGEGYSIFNMTDPDEYANNINNGAFTLAAISELLTRITEYQADHGLELNQTWVHMSNNVNIPKAKSGITLEYDGMPNTVIVKQADILLMSYPLNLRNYTMTESKVDQAYYNQKQTPDGPAMTYSIAQINENKVAGSGCAAFTYELISKLPTLRAPWYSISEQKIDDINANGGIPPAFPFLTGHAGNLQIVPNGYLGLNVGLKNLTIRPSLPPPYKSLGIPTFIYGGNQFEATMNSTHTNITRIPVKGVMGLIDKYLNKPMPITVEKRNTTEEVVRKFYHTILMNETITLENDMYWKRATKEGNVLQCHPTVSTDQVVPGQYAGAATDGNAGTRWQPLTRDVATLTVDTSLVTPQRVERIEIDFGARPPTSVRVGLTNKTTDQIISINDTTHIIPIWPLLPDQLYGQHESAPNSEVVPYIGNKTVYQLPPRLGYDIWTGNTVFLEIEGCQDCGLMYIGNAKNGTQTWRPIDALGATVGEFEILGTDKDDILSGMRNSMENETADQRQGGGDDLPEVGGLVERRCIGEAGILPSDA